MAGAVSKNILTITEPTIKVDTFDIANMESGKGDTKKDKDYLSKFIGDSYPAIRINEYDFDKPDILYFILSLDQFLPTLTVTVMDSKGMFSISQYPKDGDVLSLFIRSKDEEIYKPIRMDFDILNVDTPPVDLNSYSPTPKDKVSAAGRSTLTYTFDCRAKVPELYSEVCKGFKEDSSFNHLNIIADDLKLGFASNITNTDDKMVRIIPYDTTLKFILDSTLTAYADDNSFFTTYVDPYYYMNFVNINKQLEYDEALEDSLIVTVKDLSINKTTSDVLPANDSKLFLTNLDAGSTGTSRKIGAYSLINNSGEITLENGYSRTVQYYDEDNREYRKFVITPLITENTHPDLNPLRGRSDETRYKTQVKFKYLGKQSTKDDDGNTYLNYQYAKIHNYQNIQDLYKMHMIVDLPTANMALYRYQKIPIVMYEQSAAKIEVMNQKEQLAENKGNVSATGNDSDAKNTGLNTPKLNKFLTGIYVIESIHYIYTPGLAGIKQRLKLIRREWSNAI